MATINIDDDHLRVVMGAVDAMKTDVDAERAQLASTREPIQPYGQVWPLADRLVTAWDQRIGALSGWYNQLSVDLGVLLAKLDAARGAHEQAENVATDLAAGGAR
jgi:hypothetical protein